MGHLVASGRFPAFAMPAGLRWHRHRHRPDVTDRSGDLCHCPRLASRRNRLRQQLEVHQMHSIARELLDQLSVAGEHSPQVTLARTVVSDRFVWFRTSDSRGPGTHALVIGTSKYVHLPPSDSERAGTFGLRQLDCAASAAMRFAQWLRTAYGNPEAPLKSIRLLASPSPRENAVFAESLDVVDASGDAVEEALIAWQAEAQSYPGSVAILYLCGHGVLESQDQMYVLLSDAFARPNLTNAISVAPTQIALGAGSLRSSVIFVDACQQVPPDPRWDLSGGRKLAPPRDPFIDSRATGPVYYASSPGGSAYGIAGQGTHFCSALIDCLDRRAVRTVDRTYSGWRVTTTSLLEELKESVADLEPGQDVWASGLIRFGELHRLSEPPVLPMSVTVKPATLTDVMRSKLTDRHGDPVRGNSILDLSNPVDLPCGEYKLSFSSAPPPKFPAQSMKVVHIPPDGAIDEVELL